MRKYSPITTLLLLYTLLALATLCLWRQAHFSDNPTGDEPHYLVMANGIARHGALEQTIAYSDAFQAGQPAKFGIPADHAQLSPENMHTVQGPHGRFNMHNLGLPLLLALPFAVGGILGAKLFMVFCGGLIVLMAWKFSSLFSSDLRQRWLAVLATCIAAPLIPAANQIYPELLAGLLATLGLYWFSTTQQRRSAASELGLALAVAYLPWLQIKFGLACVAIVLAVAVRIYGESRDIRRIARLLAVAGASCVALLAYNQYAFGKISGPYLSNALEVSKTSLMVLFGLFFDQNQGFLMQNPVGLIGLLGIGGLYRMNRALLALWAIVFLSLIVPNAMHTAWYGGWCFSGRFGWAGSVVFMIPTLYGLLQLARQSSRALIAVASLSVLLQAWLFHSYAIELISLYKRDEASPLALYSQFYSSIHGWLPAFYNADWAFGYAPNAGWLLAGALLLALGFTHDRLRRQSGALVLCACAIVVLAAGYQHSRQPVTLVFQASKLPGMTGRVDGDTRVAEPGVDAPDFVNFGPFQLLSRADYTVTLKYSSLAPAGETVAVFDVYNPKSGKSLTMRDLQGSNGEPLEVTGSFSITDAQPQAMEFRHRWLGKHQFKLFEIRVTKK